MKFDDLVYHVFAQIIPPNIGPDDRWDVVDALHDDDTDVALVIMLRLIDREGWPVDPELLAMARAAAPPSLT